MQQSFSLVLAAIVVVVCACENAPSTGPQAPVAAVAVTLDRASAIVGTPVKASATLLDADGNPTIADVTWSSSNLAVAAVGSDGVINTVGAGTVTITATSEGHAASRSLMVMTSVAQVTITGLGQVEVGETYQYTSELRGWNGAVISRPVTWSVTNPQAGLITRTGALTPLVAGAVIVRATIENVTYDRAAVAVVGD